MCHIPDPSAWLVEVSNNVLLLPPVVSVLSHMLLAMLFCTFVHVGCIIEASVIRAFLALHFNMLIQFGWIVWEWRVYPALVLWPFLSVTSLFWKPTLCNKFILSLRHDTTL
jgi:hypothetical protein